MVISGNETGSGVRIFALALQKSIEIQNEWIGERGVTWAGATAAAEGRESGEAGRQETVRGEPKPSVRCLLVLGDSDGDGGGSRGFDGEGFREVGGMNRPKPT